MLRSATAAFSSLVVLTVGVTPETEAQPATQDTLDAQHAGLQGQASAVAEPPHTGPELWAELDLALTRLRALDNGPPFVFAPIRVGCFGQTAAAADQEAYRLRGEASARDLGLALEAGGRLGFQDRPLEEGVTGAYVGLSMDLFQSGLIENRRVGEVLKTRSELAAVRARLDRVEQENRCRVEAFARRMLPLTRALLAQKTTAVSGIAGAYREAYLSGASDLDALLESEQEVTRTRTELATLGAVADTDTAATVRHFPPIFDLDVEQILRRIEADETTAQVFDLTQRESRLGRDVADETRLRFYLRYGVRARSTGADGVSAGVVFRKPLFGGKKAGLESEIEGNRRRVRAAVMERVVSTQRAYDRFREQLVRTVRQHYLYLEHLERTRRSHAEWTVAPVAADLGRALDRLTALYNAALDRIGSLRELHMAGAQIFLVANQAFDAELIHQIPLPGPEYRGRTGTRALYMWSDAFNRLDNAYLRALMEAKGFRRVVLSVGQDAAPAKVIDFIGRAEAAELEVELMLSTNAWLDPDRRSGVADRVSGLTISAGGLHLDIEPHALEEFREDPERHLDAYVDVVTRARNAAGPSTPLSVSVPPWWPNSVFGRLEPLVNRFYVMAYSMTDPDQLTERLQPVLRTIDAKRLVLVLRASDFTSEWEMQLLHDRVTTATGIDQVAVHDLTGLLDLIEGRP